MKICVDFSIIRFYFSFQTFFVEYRFTIKFFFDVIADFFPNFVIFLYLSFSIFLFFSLLVLFIVFYYICLDSQKSLLYALIFGKNMHKGQIFLALLSSIKYLLPFLLKETLLDTKDLINIYNFYRDRAFMLVNILFFAFNITKFYNYFFHFYIHLKKFYIFIISRFFRLNQNLNLQLQIAPDIQFFFNILLFLMKSIFSNKFIASLLLISRIIAF